VGSELSERATTAIAQAKKDFVTARHAVLTTEVSPMRVEPFIDFAGRLVVVTGASSGLGQAIAVELNRRGATVVLVGRDHTRLSGTAAALGNDRFRLLPLDLQDLGGIHDRLRLFAGEHGRIYGLCHSAGVVETRPLSSLKLDGLHSMLNVNLTAALELARAISRRDVMCEDGGSLLFISSIYAWVGMPGQIGYSATKGAMISAARTMAVELARRRIRVNTLSPGLVRTPMTDTALAMLTDSQVSDLESAHPLGPGQPEDVARAAAFLLAPQSPWITGIDLVIDGGYTAR
jgi:NAD(P)-dependent dehydrogenase (short-subunit alcohol dehydrogenase family)